MALAIALKSHELTFFFEISSQTAPFQTSQVRMLLGGAYRPATLEEVTAFTRAQPSKTFVRVVGLAGVDAVVASAGAQEGQRRRSN